LIAAHRILASVYEELGEHGLAIERYRRVLTDVPDDVLSLNNLAYALAVHQKAPADALPLAQKAHALSKGSVASITDTLGWIHYLLGQHLEAEKYLGEAATAAPNNADVQIHLAHVYVARGRNDLAARAIARSLQLDPALAERAEVKALRVRLGSR
jgi:Tfp pilus assembly protein PilF